MRFKCKTFLVQKHFNASSGGADGTLPARA
jgi:hypothetical protein